MATTPNSSPELRNTAKRVYLVYHSKLDQAFILVDVPVPSDEAYKTLQVYSLHPGQKYKDLYKQIISSGVINRAREERLKYNRDDRDADGESVEESVGAEDESHRTKEKESTVVPSSDRVLRKRRHPANKG